MADNHYDWLAPPVGKTIETVSTEVLDSPGGNRRRIHCSIAARKMGNRSLFRVLNVRQDIVVGLSEESYDTCHTMQIGQHS